MNGKNTQIWATLHHLALVGVIVAGLLSILATNGDGGGNGMVISHEPAVANLEGTWFGTLEDPSGDLHTISLTVDGSGNLTQELLDSVDTGRTGTISQTSGTIFNFVLSDGTVGAFIADTTFTHAGFLDESFNSGVVQKSASSLPIYASTDFVGNWSGFGVTLDSTFSVVQTTHSNTAVASDLSFTETNSVTGTTSGLFTTFSSDFGLATGTYANPGSTGVTEAFLSADKSFATVWNCDTTDDGSVLVGFPADCFFFAYRFVPLPPTGSIVISPSSTNILVGAGPGCLGMPNHVAGPYLISTFDALGRPLGNADIRITLEHAGNTTLVGPVVTALVDADSGVIVSDIADPVPYQTQTDELGNKTMFVIYELTPGCTYNGNMTVVSGGVLVQMNFTIED